jgi:DUF971 family protein
MEANEKHPRPTEIQLHKSSRVLEILYDDGARFELPGEYLRVYSPSAEVRGHLPGEEKLQVNKEQVGIADLQLIGQYALKIIFDDGHKSGLYDWRYLYHLGQHATALWANYLERLAKAGQHRNAPDPFTALPRREP